MRGRCDGLPVDSDLARVDIEKACDSAQDTGLSTAGRAQKAANFPLFEGEAHLSDGFDESGTNRVVGIGDANPVEFKRVHCR
jgi:hypothetical protein